MCVREKNDTRKKVQKGVTQGERHTDKKERNETNESIATMRERVVLCANRARVLKK